MKHFVFIALVATLWACGVGASEYLPLEPGLEWTYDCGSYETHAVVCPPETVAGVEVVPLSFTWPMCNGRTYHLLDDSAGPWLLGLTVDDPSCDGFDGHPGLFFPLVRLFDLPLVAGTQSLGPIEFVSGNMIMLRTVGEETQLETPHGSYAVRPITLIFVPHIDLSVRFYLNRELGPVGYEECLLTETDVPVAAKNRSWTEIKALFR